MSNPFDDRPLVAMPGAALTSETSPRRYRPEENPFADVPVLSPVRAPATPTRQSPSIFARSRAHASSNAVASLKFGAAALPPAPAAAGAADAAPSSPFRLQIPPLAAAAALPAPALPVAGTPRAHFTSRESPRRARAHAQLVISDDEGDGSPRRLGDSGASERFLEPPQPIFSPETFAEANSDAGRRSDETLNYEYDAYQKAHEAEERSVYSDATAYSKGEGGDSDDESRSGAGGDSEYFGALIDGNIMDNLAHGYVPRSRRAPSGGGAEPKRKVRLVGGGGGNLVLENPIPDELRNVLTRTELPFGEFTNMTYTACTAHPDDFAAQGYTLRAAKYARDTEIVVCVTMYNEDEFAFARTMHGVMKNVAHLCARNKLSVWGKDAWKKVQVVIVADGRNKVNEGVLRLLTATGCYQDNLARPYVNSQRVTAHLFEYTTQISVDENLKFKGDEKLLAPVQVLFCLKERNQKKINLHRWLFNAFCPVLDPNVVVLLDVGTKPDARAVYNLWKAFDRDLNVAGAAGEIKAIKGRGWRNLLNPLVALQNFEYKMLNILDKPLELLFGYILVLPGALLAYRWIALRDNPDGTGPLAAYFKGEDLLCEGGANSKRNFFEANMYLAEDRVLCWELVAKRGESWVLKFVRLATGETDVPDLVAEFLLQRRRWINGAFFAALYLLTNARQVWLTSHLAVRKVFLHLEFAYQLVSLLFSFFSLANFYLTFYFLTGSLIDNKTLGRGGFWVFTLFNYLCVCTLAAMFIVLIGNRPQALRNVFLALIVSLTVCALYALIVGFYFVFSALATLGSDPGLTYFAVSLAVLLLLTYGLYAIMLVLYMDPWHMVTCLVQYFLMIPLYTCTLQIFAFCNTHDVLWGTKGDNNPTEDRLDRYVIEQSASGEYEATVTDNNVDEMYLETLYQIRAKRLGRRIAQPKQPRAPMEGEDYAKDVRTKVVLTWMLANLIFVLTMTQVYTAGETKSNKYLAFILWLVAVLALFRAVGLVGYLLQQLARFAVEAKHKWSHKRQGYAATAPLN